MFDTDVEPMVVDDDSSDSLGSDHHLMITNVDIKIGADSMTRPSANRDIVHMGIATKLLSMILLWNL